MNKIYFSPCLYRLILVLTPTLSLGYNGYLIDDGTNILKTCHEDYLKTFMYIGEL